MTQAKERTETYTFQDLFEFGTKRKPISQRLFQAIDDIFNIYNFRTRLLDDVYNDLFLFYTKSQIRLMVRIVLMFSMIDVFQGLLYLNDHSILFHFLIGVLFCCTIYFYTFRRMAHANYYYISIALFVIYISLTFIRVGWNVNQRSLFRSGMLLVVLLFSLTPVEMDTCVILSCVFVTSYLTFVYYESTYLNTRVIQVDSRETIPFNLLEQHGVELRTTHNIYLLIAIEAQLFLMCICAGLHQHIWNNLRRHAAFLRLSQSVQSKAQGERATAKQLRWIEAVMPHKVCSEYWRMWRRNQETSSTNWIYCQVFEDVSILFADICGFTKMSSNKTANQVVMLLNDLFNRFDDLCRFTNCEKLGTLGDCYYCVAGCPTPQLDHATCCIEMGLGMCRIIKSFNVDHRQSVNMRIGIHTGRVNAAIIGRQRFRYDVFSFDVIIANEMESSGLPGRVHISEATYALVSNVYRFARGDDLEVKREVESGIAGMKLGTIKIGTYFVDPKSSYLRHKNERFGKEQVEFRVMTITTEKPEDNLADGDEDFEMLSDEASSTSNEDVPSRASRHVIASSSTDNRYTNRQSWCDASDTMTQSEFYRNCHEAHEGDLTLINDLCTDRDAQAKLFRHLPVNSVSYFFLNDEVEWNYLNHTRDQVLPVSVDTLKLAPVIDAIIVYIIVILTFTTSICFEQSYRVFILGSVFIFIASVLLGFITWSSTTYASLIQSSSTRCIYLFLSHCVTKEVAMCIISLLPFIFSLDRYLRSIDDDGASLLIVSIQLNHMRFISIITVIVVISSTWWTRVLCVAILQLTFVLMQLGLYNRIERNAPGNQTSILRDKRIDIFHSPMLMHIRLLLLENLVLLFTAVLITRQSEFTCRLCFFITREARISDDEAEKSQQESQTLLHNIIPAYVFEHLRREGMPTLDPNSMSYAVSIQRVGVVFACISNFFSKYYREDYKGGVEALKLLNNIICTFDDLLLRPMFKDVEKIKTINDCYMIASGLNTIERERNDDDKAHLVALMEFCFMIQFTLTDFNEKYIIGSDKFEIKIGYNVGSVTAGIIGTTKPLYDIWGDTVNVSSRMYSTGSPGIIQVPYYVKEILQLTYKFVYRGKIFVKGKGDMDTYICEQKAYC